jgi:hypothetical protein
LSFVKLTQIQMQENAKKRKAVRLINRLIESSNKWKKQGNTYMSNACLNKARHLLQTYKINSEDYKLIRREPFVFR